MNKVAYGIGRFLRVLGLATLVLIPVVGVYLLLYNAIGTFMRRETSQIPLVMADATPIIAASATTVVGNATPTVVSVLPTPTVGKTETTPLPTSTTTDQAKHTETTVAKVQPTVVSTTPTPVRSEPAPRPVPTITPVPQSTAIPEPPVPRITWFSIGTGQVVKINRGGCVSGDVAMAWGQDQDFTPYHDDEESTAHFTCVGDAEAGWAKAPFGASSVYGLSWDQLGDTIKAQGKFPKVIGLLFPGAVPIYEK